MSSILSNRKETLFNSFYYLGRSKILLTKQKYQFSYNSIFRYFEFLNIFSKKEINILFFYCFYNYTIYFKKDIQFLIFVLYNINYNKTLELCYYLKKNFSKKFIRISYF